MRRRAKTAATVALLLATGAWSWPAARPVRAQAPVVEAPSAGRAAAVADTDWAHGSGAARPLALPPGPLTLNDVIALALQNNPTARAAVASARGASAAYASAKGRYFPALSFDPTLTKTQVLTGARVGAVPGGTTPGLTAAPGATQRTQVTPTLTLSYLLFDFGGRGGTVDQARQAAEAASDMNDATVQGTVLQAESAYFTFNAARDLLAAERENVRSAEESRAAAVGRYHVGLATMADTLQAATAAAQAQLELLTAQGQLQTARGNLAAAIGTTAEQPFEVAAPAGLPPVSSVAANVDSLIAQAVRERPDLAAAEAQALGARDQVRIARSGLMPALSVSGTAGRAFSDSPGLSGDTYGLTLGLDLPLFNGLSKQNDLKAAAAQADAAQARADATRVQVANQVFTSYANLQVATARVQASASALASATASEQVARGRYAEGVGTFTDLVVAQGALASARAQDAQARWGWYAALAQLGHDAGTLDRTGEAHLQLTADPTNSPRIP